MRFATLFSSLLLICFVGCLDAPARQQQAEEVRRSNTANDLRELGEAIQQKNKFETTPESETKTTPNTDTDSQDSETRSSKPLPQD